MNGEGFRIKVLPAKQRGNDLGQVQQERKVVAGDAGDHSERFAYDAAAAENARTGRIHQIGGGLQRQIAPIVVCRVGESAREMLERRIDLHGIGDALGAADLGDDQTADPIARCDERAMHASQDGGALGHGQNSATDLDRRLGVQHRWRRAAAAPLPSGACPIRRSVAGFSTGSVLAVAFPAPVDVELIDMSVGRHRR